jgi:hypothetical protein
MEWSRAANELGIPREDLVPLLHHALADEAQTLFDKEIDGKITQLADAFFAPRLLQHGRTSASGEDNSAGPTSPPLPGEEQREQGGGDKACKGRY